MVSGGVAGVIFDWLLCGVTFFGDHFSFCLLLAHAIVMPPIPPDAVQLRGAAGLHDGQLRTHGGHGKDGHHSQMPLQEETEGLELNELLGLGCLSQLGNSYRETNGQAAAEHLFGFGKR